MFTLTKNIRYGMGTKEKIEKVIREAAAKWPTTFVARSKISEFTGGIYTVQTMTNLDSKGEGPDDAFRIGFKVAYPVDSLCDWLISRAKGIREV